MEEINLPITFSSFESSVYGFKVDHPTTWLKSENNSFFVVGFRESEELPYPAFNVQILDLEMFGGEGNTRIDHFQQMIMGQILRIGAKPSGFTDELVGGIYNGKSIIFYIPNDNMKSKQTFFFNGGYVYLISYTSKADEIFQNHLYVHDHAISSFTLFKSKGYKHFQLSINSKSLDLKLKSHSPDSLFLEYYHPKDWSTENINSSLSATTKHTDPQNKQISYSITLVEKKNENHTIQDFIKFETTNGKSHQGETLDQDEHIKDIDLLVNYRDGMAKKLKINAKQVDYSDSNSTVNKSMIVFEFDNVFVSLVFTTPQGDTQYYICAFNRFISYLGIITHRNLRGRSPVPYDIFDNLLIGYSLHVPTTFSLSSCKPTGEVISFKDDEKAYGLSYCVRIVVEDLKAAGIIKLHQYSGDVVGKMLQQQPESQLLTQDPTFLRLDKHLASTVSIQSYDPELNGMAIQLVVTSVQKSHGIVFSIRTKATDQFNIIYKNSFYIFDSFIYYNDTK